MIRLITCKNCGKSEGLILTIDWKYKEESCDKCNNTKTFNKIYDFCSYDCLMEWLKKANKCIVNNEHEWKSKMDNKEYEQLMRIHGDISYMIEEYCVRCGQTRYIEKKIS